MINFIDYLFQISLEEETSCSLSYLGKERLIVRSPRRDRARLIVRSPTGLGEADCSPTWPGPGKDLVRSLGTRQGGSGGHSHRSRSPRCFGVVCDCISSNSVVAGCFHLPQVIVQ